MKSDRTFIAIIICVAPFFFSSCTVLQWRQTDAEILEDFSAKNITTEISYFNVDTLDLKVRIQHVRQSENNINLLFFHGSPSSLAAWKGYLTDSTLVKNAQLHAVDRPGYGYSNFGNEMTSITDQANLMSALIDQYQLKNVIVVGASYGGPLVARMAILNENIKAVVMISPAIDPKQEKQIWASRLTQWRLTRWLVPTSYRVAGDEKTVHANELTKLESDWKKVTVPVTHIHGTLDDVVPFGNTEYTPTVFSNIAVIELEGLGHEIAWGKAELVIPILHSIISKITIVKEKP